MDTIINFGDDLEEEIFERATANAKMSDLMLCLGTTLTVTPANELVEVGKKPLRLVICNRYVGLLCRSLLGHHAILTVRGKSKLHFLFFFQTKDIT